MDTLTRRRLLTGAGVVTAGAVAGCLDDIGAEQSGTGAESEGTVLGAISIENLDGNDHTVDIIVQRNSEVDHWSTHELSSGQGTTVEADWPTSPGNYQIITRLDGDQLRRTSLSPWGRQDCLNLTIIVTRDGDLSVLTDTDADSCET